ncbi:MAG: hypothetical protein Q9187_000268 [Circinaria calcarea]
MNTIREIQALNKRELEAGVSTEASWHADYRDTAYIYIGGLSFDLTEGDVIAIFSQFGEPVHINLVRDKETGKSKGFAFLKYEDQRSTDLAVDNLGGVTVLGRVLKVDHTRYKKKEGEEGEGEKHTGGVREAEENGNETPDGVHVKRRRKSVHLGEDGQGRRPQLKEEEELERLIRDHDEEDPMKKYLVQEKREEVAQALIRLKQEGRATLDGKTKHHHRHSSRKDEGRDRRDKDGPKRNRHHRTDE